jgi:WD40 repeat protein
VGTRDGQVHRLRSNDLGPIGEPLQVKREPITALALSQDGKALACGDANDAIIIWQLADRSFLRLEGHMRSSGVRRPVRALSFTSDGRTLASLGGDHYVILWDAQSGRTLLPQPITGHKMGVITFALSPDGQTLATGGADDEVLLWTIGPETILRRIERIANRNLTRDEWRRYIGDEPYRATHADLPVPAAHAE